MKLKNILLISGLLFVGCANNTNIPTPPKYSLLQKYQITQNSLKPINNGYVFFKTGVAGAEIYYLDKKYNLIKKVATSIFVEPMKIKVKNNQIYILGMHKNKPIVLVYDENGKLIKHYAVGEKFDIPVDIVDNIVLLTKYDNGSYINFGKVNLKMPDKSLTANKVIKFNNGYIVVGTIMNNNEDLVIAFIKNNKLIWTKTYDFGMNDNIDDISVKDNNLYLDVYTTDYIGAKTEYKIVLDKNGNIIKKSKGMNLQELPLRFKG